MEAVLRHIRGRAAAQDLSTKLLLVDDDELELVLMADRLTAVGLQVVCASNGVEALQILDREWVPVVLTDWRMPVMDGMELVESLRSKAGEEVYIIMLSAQASAEDIERGYFNGVDDYVSKKSSDAELLARIEAAFNTVMLRRSLKQVRTALAAAVQTNPGMQGNEAQRATLMHLQAELARARRYRHPLSMILLRVSVQPAQEQAEAPHVDEPLWRALVQTLGSLIRIQIDRVGELDVVDNVRSCAIVLPETAAAGVPVVQQRLLGGLSRLIAQAAPSELRLQFDFGSTSLDALEGSDPPDALQFLAAAQANAVYSIVLQPGVAIDLAALRPKDDAMLSDQPFESDARRRANS